MSSRWAVTGFLVAAVVSSAVASVYAKHRTRTLFVELQGLERMRDAMQVEWGQLELEQGTWSTHDRVTKLAREKLGLHTPPGDAVILVTPR